MSTLRRNLGLLAAAPVVLLAFTRFAAAQAADTAEIQRYTLTETALSKYTEAASNLASLPGACEDDDSESDSQSLDAMVAKLESVPGAKAAVQAAGMTSREYVVFTFSVLQNGLAAWAASQPGGSLPPGVSKANVDFVTKHEAELEKITELESDCNGDEDDAEE